MTGSKRLVPKRRFKEFENSVDWEQLKLGEALSLLKDGTHGTHNNVDEGFYLLSAKNIKNGKIIIDHETDRIISKEEYKKIHKNFQLKKDDVLLTIVGSIGESAILKNPTNITFQRSVAYLRPNDKITSRFLFATINTKQFQLELKNQQVVSAQPGIYLGVLNDIDIRYPEKMKEQTQIGSFFHKLDKLISLQQEKIKKAKALKSAYLSGMFPKEGEKYPKLRFKGFTESWEEQKLGEMLIAHSFKPYLVEPQTEGKYEVIQQGNNPIIGYSNGRPFLDFENVVLFGDHTLSLYKPQTPFFIATDGVKIIGSTDNIKGDFLYYLLQRYIPSSEGYKRYYSILKNCECMISFNQLEQKNIGIFFSQLDKLITLHQRKLKKLENLKKAYLNEMFV